MARSRGLAEKGCAGGRRAYGGDAARGSRCRNQGRARLGDPIGEPSEQIDPKAHIACLDDCSVAGGGFDLGLVLGREPGRADDVDDARLRGDAGKATMAAFGVVKSSTPCTSANRQRIVGDGDAQGPGPATSPKSWPIAGEPLASMPAARMQPGVAATARASVCPIRPAAPSTASFMSDMARGPSMSLEG